MPPQYNRSNEKFVNPYHFVPLGNKCDKSKNYRETRETTNLNTGWIDCTLTTKFPIFIPNTTCSNAFGGFDGKRYEFYSEDDLSGNTVDRASIPPQQPAIPASELRGMIRSSYEAVTNACLSTTADDHILYKRTSVHAEPGIIKRDGDSWYIQPCERLGLAAWRKYAMAPNANDRNDFSDDLDLEDFYPHGKKVFVDKSAGPYRPHMFHFVTTLDEGGLIEGTLSRGDAFTRKHHESVFIETASETISISEPDLENLRKNIEFYRDNRINQMAGHKGYSFITKSQLANPDGLPIYYAEHNGRFYLSPAAIGREVFHNRLKDLIGSYSPCMKLDQLCPGCNLFGLAGKDESAVSRLSFTMGRFTKGPNNANTPSYLTPIIPAELASPKTSATEFYLKRPKGNSNLEADLWNYDYAGSWGNNLIESNNYQPEIRGRKFYWHGNLRQTPPNQADSKRHVKIRPLNTGNTFTFKIHFNSITDAELKQLVWTLTIGQSGEHAHKIGMGKPVGLGSVQIAVDALKLRQISLNDGNLDYAIKEMEEAPCATNDEMHTIGGQKAINAFLAITKLNHEYNIDYPRLTNQDQPESYKWFVGNRQVQGTGGNGTKPKIDQSLPGIHNPELRKLTVSQQQNNQHHRQGHYNNRRNR